MKFYCKWREEATVLYKCYGWVEAESEEEAITKIKKGEVDIDDCVTWDTLDSTVIDVDDIYEDIE